MIGLLIGIATAVLFSCLFLWSYRRGLKDGLALKDNKPIEPIKTPVQAFYEHTEEKETKKTESIQSIYATNLFDYDGNKQDEVN